MKKGRLRLVRMCRSGGVIALCGLLSFSAAADIKIAILEFELYDLTLDPRRPEELERTASIKSSLQKTLHRKGGYDLIEINPGAQEEANAGFGYLFDHHDAAARLGKDFGADWILVGRVHKASFLFVYFMAHLVNAHTQELVGDYIVEVKGPQRMLTIKGVERLAEKVDTTIEAIHQSR
jgi:Protein of unknown function (DUF2380)